MNMEIIAHSRPTIALRAPSTGRPVTSASVVTGMPIDPNATGAVFASRQMPAAKNGSKPRPGEHRAGHGHRRAKSRRALDERAE